MTYQDPNVPRRPMAPDDPHIRRVDRNETSYTGWILGGLAALALIVGVFFMVGRDDGTKSTASINTNRPVATQPASPPANPPSTTGSGTTSPPPANR